MSTFSKLTLLAQYDDMCRLVMKLIKDSSEEEDASIAMLEDVQKRWYSREDAHEREKEDLREEIATLKKEVKKLNRQLAESRNALHREIEDKKAVARERKALFDQIRQVRQLVESKDGLGNTDAHRKRLINSLNIERLSPIQSDVSDDNVSGLDFDRTEDEIVEAERSRRSIIQDALETIASAEQPTMLCRYYDKGNEEPQSEEPRRSSRRSGRDYQRASHVNSTRTLPNTNRHRYENAPAETDSNDLDSDENSIEWYKQQLQKFEAEKEKKEKLASTISTPSMKINNKAATLSAKSSASMRSISNVPRPQEHKFGNKKNLTNRIFCGPCGGKVSFWSNVAKCENCLVNCHPECQDKCPLPCVKITAPMTRSRSKKAILIADYVNDGAELKVPALIVHCCNEIEKPYNIETHGLYRVVSNTVETEALQQKILKSKSGMPNLVGEDVHLLTGVVKRFLQSLDETLITTTLWSKFREAVETLTGIELLSRMEHFIDYDLPPSNRQTLAYLMQHLHAIAKHSSKNEMTTKMLAKALAPSIVGYHKRDISSKEIDEDKKAAIRIMEALFDIIDEEFWAGHAPRMLPNPQAISVGSRLLATPSRTESRTRSSRNGGSLQTPKIKPVW